MNAHVDLRRALAADPAPASIERSALARLHFRHAVTTDDEVARVVMPAEPPNMPAELPAVMAETHATLLDPSGCAALPHPSPIASAVREHVTSRPEWQAIADAAAMHPSVARDAVVSLGQVILDAMAKSGAKHDAARTLADLDAARRALEEARKRATLPGATRDDLKASVDAKRAEERAEGEAAAMAAAASRLPDALDDAGLGRVVATIATKATATAEGIRVAMVAGIGAALGVDNPAELPQDVIDLLSPRVVALLKLVGAMRLSLREGRSTRHLPGREGMLGPDVGGLDRVGDLMPLERAALAGLLGDHGAALARLRLVQGRASVVEKGGGRATKGDVVIDVDQSDSTEGPRSTWIGALAVALLLEARAENRQVGVVTYSGAVRASVLVDGPTGLRAALAALCREPDGGTNTAAALIESGKLLRRMRKGGAPADVVILTDGAWEATDLDGADLDRARLHAAFVGGSCPPGAKFASVWGIADHGMTTDKGVEIARVLV